MRFDFIAMVFAAIVFIVVPALLTITEYRLTKKNKQYGLYLMIGIFASSILLGAYSLLVGVFVLIAYLAASNHDMDEKHLDKQIF